MRHIDIDNPLLVREFPSTLSRDLFGLICDELLGYGISRRVYVYAPNTTFVIKFEAEAGWFQNILEWETWDAVKGTKFEKWFAPCRMISPCGTILVMARTTPLAHKDYPVKMPSFLTDFKYDNYGLFEDNVVCHDYGTHNLMTMGMTSRLKKADWWGD